MKELSIEEKAKAYDETLAKAAKIHRNYKGRVRAVDVVIEEVFPELKEESEGERIRERICKLLWDNVPYEEAQEYIAWLEKQGNPTEDELEALRMAAYEPTKNWSEKLQSLYEKLTHCEQKPVIEMKTPEESLGIDSDTYNKIVDECIYGEQKPTNKVEPKFKIGDNIEPIDTCMGSPRTIYKICDGFYETNQGTLDFEFENNWRLIEQKPAWTEDDESRIIAICTYLQDYARLSGSELRTTRINEYCDWLKSLKERYTWKPSDEQITWLYRAADMSDKNSRMKQVLNELLSDLKKLI